MELAVVAENTGGTFYLFCRGQGGMLLVRSVTDRCCCPREMAWRTDGWY